MPVKLIGIIILLILVTIFAGLNIDNKCIIDFGVYQTQEVPVFITVIISFAIGAILMIPFMLARKSSKKEPKKGPAPSENKEQGKKSEGTESKTLFDFKIKREAKTEEKTKKSLFGLGKNKESSDTAKKEKEAADAPKTAPETPAPETAKTEASADSGTTV